MTKILLFGVFMLAACAPAPVNVYPTPLPSPTLAVHTRPIGEGEKAEALNFFYALKIKMALGDYDHFTKEVRYPITAKVAGQPRTFIFAAQFEANFEKMFSREAIQEFISTDESALTFSEQGVKVADGIIWFDLICIDPDCAEAEYLITEINN